MDELVAWVEGDGRTEELVVGVEHSGRKGGWKGERMAGMVEWRWHVRLLGRMVLSWRRLWTAGNG